MHFWFNKYFSLVLLFCMNNVNLNLLLVHAHPIGIEASLHVTKLDRNFFFPDYYKLIF